MEVMGDTRLEAVKEDIRVNELARVRIIDEKIRLIQQHPDLELVGAVVHHQDKAGKDVGEILRGQPIGLKTIGESEAALGLHADVVLYNAPFERYDEIIRILASGKNVITPSAAFYPRSRPEFNIALCNSSDSIDSRNIRPILSGSAQQSP